MASIIIGALKATPEKDVFDELFHTQVPLIFTLVHLTWWSAILSKWFNIVVTFAWSFTDLFVMVVSIGLASQFRQINTDLQQIKGKVFQLFLVVLILFHKYFKFDSTCQRDIGLYGVFSTAKWRISAMLLITQYRTLHSSLWLMICSSFACKSSGV